MHHNLMTTFVVVSKVQLKSQLQNGDNLSSTNIIWEKQASKRQFFLTILPGEHHKDQRYKCLAFSFDFFFLKPSQKRQSEVSKKTSYSLGIHPAQPINEILPDIFNSVNLINLRSVTVLLCKHVTEFTGQ